ncbi:ADP-ribosylglycohydrolase/catechol 2,3-dioxygenase-like lactoylglutathione lyase family enzyme [Rhizobium skierniewicense]|uniref:ADP-ribosylglycohydrolase/catechol 2,3-dioxygenase-like lactoylglutathione lyase family enzyme n=1 Tax=Rhizobium skierniewicense TaxID=984260 RepID=A0A7W6FZV9_9HYPH|nr:ADP-ribosylglycohydrolase family protein [Rhizobium skierniewicense]MBB3944092.1 ADP-ribosylglycohydrolase/catechol 2,3-dioxygenase-like lactoylglutathione lyase family enzyme [Rhizobium skierniewicense]
MSVERNAANVSEIKFQGVILGAAFGDALGWPQEGRAQNSSSSKKAALSFYDWVKRSGGRFQPHEEVIPAGTYSDDTQLIIAGARARLNYVAWWQYLARVELPLWTIYERGGGGASLRAARLWLKGSPPWEAGSSDRDRYYQAGGNGVAMRVAPHVLLGVRDERFDSVAQAVIADGVITHGHPEALVGALAYAFALWYAVRINRTLDYGELLSALLKHQAQWATWPDIDAMWPAWIDKAQEHGFETRWGDAVSNMIERLRVGADSLEAGALSLDGETMQRLGCFDKAILGAGTVAAAAAIYLASRHAAGPMEGVLTAAFAKGSDTDTIASMTGALCGATSGTDWIGAILQEVQDTRYLNQLAQELAANRSKKTDGFEMINAKILAKIIAELSNGKKNVPLPRGFPTSARPANLVRSKSRGLRSQSWQLETPDAPTIVIKKLSKAPQSSEDNVNLPQLQFGSPPQHQEVNAVLAGICLVSIDLDRSVEFYNLILGLPVLSRTQSQVRLDHHLVLRRSERNEPAGSGTIVFIRHRDLDGCVKRLAASGIEASDSGKGDKRKITCVDPDGRTVELIEAVLGSK